MQIASPPSCLQDFQVDHKLIRRQEDEAQAGISRNTV